MKNAMVSSMMSSFPYGNLMLNMLMISDYHDTRDFGGQKMGDLRFQDVSTIFEHTFCQVQPTCSSKWWWQSASWIVGRGWNACHSHVAPCLRFREISLMMSCGQGCSPQHFLQELVMTQGFLIGIPLA